MAEEEIAKLQEELKMALNEVEKPVRLRFKKHSPEGELVTETIRRRLAEIDKMRRTNDPFEQRIEKAKGLFNFIMANPNVIAYIVELRQASINKAHEMVDADYSQHEGSDTFKGSLRQFITWAEGILPNNIYYRM